MSSGATELAYGISHPADTGTSFHSKTELDDAAGIGSKVWTFDLNSDAGFGLQSQFEERHSGVTKSQTNATWASDALSRPYIATTVTTLDATAQKRSDQVLDQYGNMTSMSLYDFGAATPTRVYNNTYLSDATGGHPAGSTYNAQHIHNRLLTSTVTQNSQTTTLVSNSYDSYDP
jgi:hypothetical protein